MKQTVSVQRLADLVNLWCQAHRVHPANGQAGEQISVRNIRYYRTLGLLDPPELGGGQGFGEKHRLQLIAIRLSQAQGLPLSRIQQLLFGRSLEALSEIEQRGLLELQETRVSAFRPSGDESWNMMPLNDEFMLVSRRGRSVGADVRQRLLAVLDGDVIGKNRTGDKNE
jgi:DNA-binding transcriptional MerR regulator